MFNLKLTIKRCSLIFLLFVNCVCVAQNLVPNGDFEQFHSCPTGAAQLDSALFWFNPSIGGMTNPGTPDYFNVCGFSFAGVPNNGGGYQEAHSGNGYAGIVILGLLQPNYREYIEDSLTSALIDGECYHFACYCNLANRMKYTSDGIGVYFSDTAVVNINNYHSLPFTAQINNTVGNVFDTLNWTLVEGDYLAAGGEKYIIIGNFKDDISTDTLVVNNAAANPIVIYVYIDDVSLTQVSCITGVKENNLITTIKIFPIPFAEELNIELKNSESCEITLYDVTSRKLLQQHFINSVSINTEELSKGIYFYEVRNRNGEVGIGKVIKE